MTRNAPARRASSRQRLQWPSERRDGVVIYNADVFELYHSWESPTVIVSDGAYGISGFPGDPPTAEGLAAWYEPHVIEWSRKATAATTLWFWNTELGWATVHPILKKHGWRYRNCHIWNKGMAHVAGNTNTQKLRKFPVVTEVCVQYVREAEFPVNSHMGTMQEWLRYEWERSGVPLYQANKVCGVKNAATRKYLTNDHLWYYPPPDMFERMAEYLNKHGDPTGRPYLSLDGKKPISGRAWATMRAKFTCELGITNVWEGPAVRDSERLKKGLKCVHLNQKPLRFIELNVRSSSDPGDMVWEPFGGLCTVALASWKLGRQCRSAEVIKDYYFLGAERLRSATKDAKAAQPARASAKSET